MNIGKGCSFIKNIVMRAIKFMGVLMILTLINSCSSTRIASSWKADDAKTKPYHNIMVWGMLPEKDSLMRKQVEVHMVNDLVSKGYHAVASTDVYKEKAYKKLNSGEILSEFKQTGVDAVITMVLLKKEKEEKYFPGGVFNQPVDGSGNLDRYHTDIFEKVLTPGYYISSTNFYWEAVLFELVREKPVYVVRTNSFDPASADRLAHENGELIIKDMLKKKIILDKIPPEE